jgi:hypothetical protein
MMTGFCFTIIWRLKRSRSSYCETRLVFVEVVMRNKIATIIFFLHWYVFEIFILIRKQEKLIENKSLFSDS